MNRLIILFIILAIRIIVWAVKKNRAEAKQNNFKYDNSNSDYIDAEIENQFESNNDTQREIVPITHEYDMDHQDFNNSGNSQFNSDDNLKIPLSIREKTSSIFKKDFSTTYLFSTDKPSVSERIVIQFKDGNNILKLTKVDLNNLHNNVRYDSYDINSDNVLFQLIEGYNGDTLVLKIDGNKVATFDRKLTVNNINNVGEQIIQDNDLNRLVNYLEDLEKIEKVEM